MPTRAKATLACLAVALILPGCMTFEIGSNASITDESTNAHETVSGSLYGFSWREHHIQKCDESALAHVEYHFNGFQLLASALSLGLWIPQTVEWWCDDPSVEDDEEEDEPDPGGEFDESLLNRIEGINS
jgi:hypothetical protein